MLHRYSWWQKLKLRRWWGEGGVDWGGSSGVEESRARSRRRMFLEVYRKSTKYGAPRLEPWPKRHRQPHPKWRFRVWRRSHQPTRWERSNFKKVAVLRGELREKLLDKNLLPARHDDYHTYLRPWKFDRKTKHDGFKNTYTFEKDEVNEVNDLFALVVMESNDDNVEVPHPVAPILEDFSDVFPNELPPGLPPMRDIQHCIDFVPGAVIPQHTE
ncbi:hypothetical protein Tco_0668202 [Tanacetum coccineum]